MRNFVTLGGVIIFATSFCVSQQTTPATERGQGTSPITTPESKTDKLRRLPVEWLIGPYIPVQEALQPLNMKQREETYVRQTFLTVGSYTARLFSAGIDQARGVPYQWGGGFAGYGKRYAARYGQFVIQNTIVSASNAALGYEPRYDFCRCRGFWPRTGHAVSRAFLAYNRTEEDLRPQVPTYAGAFVAGVIYSSWRPEQHNIWKGGAISMLSQAGIGSGYNFVSEFSLDILHKFGIKKQVQPNE
jgi:hypothetical protein